MCGGPRKPLSALRAQKTRRGMAASGKVRCDLLFCAQRYFPQVSYSFSGRMFSKMTLSRQRCTRRYSSAVRAVQPSSSFAFFLHAAAGQVGDVVTDKIGPRQCVQAHARRGEPARGKAGELTSQLSAQHLRRLFFDLQQDGGVKGLQGVFARIVLQCREHRPYERLARAHVLEFDEQGHLSVHKGEELVKARDAFAVGQAQCRKFLPRHSGDLALRSGHAFGVCVVHEHDRAVCAHVQVRFDGVAERGGARKGRIRIFRRFCRVAVQSAVRDGRMSQKTGLRYAHMAFSLSGGRLSVSACGAKRVPASRQACGPSAIL